MRWIFITGAIFLSFAVPATAWADRIEFTYEADVTSIGIPWSGLSVGDKVTGTFWWDDSALTGATSLLSDGSLTAYEDTVASSPGWGWTLEVAGSTFQRGTSDRVGERSITVVDRTGPNLDQLILDSGQSGTYSFDLRLVAAYTLLSSTELPGALDLADWSQGAPVSFVDWAHPDTRRFSAEITSVSAVSAVPEPTSLGLLALGLGFVGLTYRRRARA